MFYWSLNRIIIVYNIKIQLTHKLLVYYLNTGNNKKYMNIKMMYSLLNINFIYKKNMKKYKYLFEKIDGRIHVSVVPRERREGTFPYGNSRHFQMTGRKIPFPRFSTREGKRQFQICKYVYQINIWHFLLTLIVSNFYIWFNFKYTRSFNVITMLSDILLHKFQTTHLNQNTLSATSSPLLCFRKYYY